MTSKTFNIATTKNFENACIEKDGKVAFSIIVNDFENNASVVGPYDFSPFIISTLERLARDHENNDFLQNLLTKVSGRFPEKDLLHLAVLDGANELQDNDGMLAFLDDALACIFAENPEDTLNDGEYDADDDMEVLGDMASDNHDYRIDPDLSSSDVGGLDYGADAPSNNQAYEIKCNIA